MATGRKFPPHKGKPSAPTKQNPPAKPADAIRGSAAKRPPAPPPAAPISPVASGAPPMPTPATPDTMPGMGMPGMGMPGGLGRMLRGGRQ